MILSGIEHKQNHETVELVSFAYMFCLVKILLFVLMVKRNITLVCFFQTPTSVLHEHATLKMVQRYSILLSKLYAGRSRMRAAKTLSARL